MKMIEVFKTNVPDSMVAELLMARLQRIFPGCRVNFDLDDCDRVLRIEGHDLCSKQIMALCNTAGYDCAVLV